MNDSNASSSNLETVGKLRDSLNSVLIGQAKVVDELLIGLLAGGHVLIEGVPGLGKTLLVRALAQVIQGQFKRVQFTPDLMPSDISGHAIFDAKSESFRIRKGPIFANLVLADEINRAPAKTQAALLEAMQEHQVSIEGQAIPTPQPFFVVATQNPVEHEGTYPLPEAQLDRFLLKIIIDYPSEADEILLVEKQLSGRVASQLTIEGISPVVDGDGMMKLQVGIAATAIEKRVIDYAVRIVTATREWPGIMVGASPRGSLALLRAARVHAVINGRDFVIPDDVKAIAASALRHRLILAPELEIEARRSDDVLASLLEKVEAPRE